ncbi:MAG: SWIM zinc finger family protein [Pseudomonadota bacterium]|nr:SWIM zinc finger family protein [Pseudomonadota bacterium]
MEFRYRYYGQTGVDNAPDAQSFRFAPDTLRPPTHFQGQLGTHGDVHLAFREALSALHAVVVDDQRPRGRDKTAYQAWLQATEGERLAALATRNTTLRERASQLGAELRTLRADSTRVMQPFYAARQKYFNWLYEANRDAWYVLDPVISVHPDRLLFEAFSQDESSYCAVSVRYDAFSQLDERALGTTNIDYSASLLEEFQKIRGYRATRFTVDPGGFGVHTEGGDAYREEKIDLPDSWVRGFLQVSSAAALPATVVELHPMDVHNLCAVLRQRRERAGPRSIRFELGGNGPVRMVFEPWNIAVTAPRARVQGAAPTGEPIRIWGRRRLLVLERLIAQATRVQVHLLGSGMPSFWVVDLPGVTVTLGLSGWSANDWSASGRFGLLAPRHELPAGTAERVGVALQQRWHAGSADIASALDLAPRDAAAALTAWVQAGRAVFDLAEQRYYWRELAREPLPIDALRFASPEEAAALQLAQSGAVRLQEIRPGTGSTSGQVMVTGSAQVAGKTFEPVLLLDAEERLIDARCTCNFYTQNKLRRGPCAHVLALKSVAVPALGQRAAAMPEAAA